MPLLNKVQNENGKDARAEKHNNKNKNLYLLMADLLR